MQRHVGTFCYLFKQPMDDAIVKFSGLVLGIEQDRMFHLEGAFSDHLVQLPDQLRAIIKGIVQMPFQL